MALSRRSMLMRWPWSASTAAGPRRCRRSTPSRSGLVSWQARPPLPIAPGRPFGRAPRKDRPSAGRGPVLAQAGPNPLPASGERGSALLCRLVGIDHLARGELGRGDDGLRVHALELVEGVAFNAVVLHRDHARLGPL